MQVDSHIVNSGMVNITLNRNRSRLSLLFYLLLLVGIALRCVALASPLLDAHDVRQCQTAAATEDLAERTGFHLSSRIPWAGNFDVYYLLELPVYNYLVIGFYHLLHNLDVSGKTVTILLWTSSFVVLQFIWRRFLTKQQAHWANLLFVISPLSVFYGQAFMPEMLVQLLAFAFILLAIRYDEAPSLMRWGACAGIGLLGCLVKFPEFGHLYLIPAVLVFSREKARAFIRPRYFLAAALTISGLWLWSRYMDSVNVDPLSFGPSQNNLIAFIGTGQSRFQLVPWVMIAAYLIAFIAPGAGMLIATYGLVIYLRGARSKLLDLWLLSLVIFYLIWFGNAASSQSYYNLVALAPICALFAIGLSRLFTQPFLPLRWRYPAATIAVLFVLLPAIPVYRHLFHQDDTIQVAAKWVRANTAPGDIILFRPNHSSAMIDYPYNPILSYYTKRPTFIWTKNTPEVYRSAALQRANYAVVTLPQPPPTGLLGLINRFRQFSRPPESTDWLESAGFRAFWHGDEFLIYTRDRR